MTTRTIKAGAVTYTPRSTVDYPKELKLCPRVFVYGSLKKNSFNNSILGGSRCLGTTRTHMKFVLGNVGYPYAFPDYVVPKEYKHLLGNVQGEVFEIENEEVFRSLDCLEGYPSHYDRKIINLENGMMAWMYHQMNWNLAQRCDACEYKDGVWTWL